MRQIAKQIALHLLRAYKWAISPLFPPACRYVPTCSEYAMEAIERYGALRGLFMAIARVLRCHPFVRGGYDPVVNAGDDCTARRWRTFWRSSRWKSGALAPCKVHEKSTGFSPCAHPAQTLERTT